MRALGSTDRPLRLDDRVLHATFGPGEVNCAEGDRVGVASVGHRTPAVPDVLESGLLKPAEG